MAEAKTRPTTASVDAFLDGVRDTHRRAESRRLIALLRDITGEEPVMWGDKIVGFGQYHYRYDSGREGDWMLVGFSPQQRHLSLYLMAGVQAHADILDRLGPHQTGSGCVYIRRLDDVDEGVLRELVEASIDRLRSTYGEG